MLKTLPVAGEGKVESRVIASTLNNNSMQFVFGFGFFSRWCFHTVFLTLSLQIYDDEISYHLQ